MAMQVQQMQMRSGARSGEALTIGDQVCLFSEEALGFIFCMQSRSAATVLLVGLNIIISICFLLFAAP